MGVGKAIESASNLENAVKDMTAITGQKPQVTRAKKSISNFKLREGMPIGCRVTLRGERMYEFLDRLINVALPRTRDFRGVSSKMSGRGDYNLGLKEQFIFPEDRLRQDRRRPGHEHHGGYHRQDRRGRARAAAAVRYALPELREFDRGQEVPDRQGEQEAQVQGAAYSRCRQLRAPARVHSQVRSLPYLLPGTGAQRRHPGRGQGQLVKGDSRHDDRSDRGHAHAHPQRGEGPAPPGGRPREQHETGARRATASARVTSAP